MIGAGRHRVLGLFAVAVTVLVAGCGNSSDGSTSRPGRPASATTGVQTPILPTTPTDQETGPTTATSGVRAEPGIAITARVVQNGVIQVSETITFFRDVSSFTVSTSRAAGGPQPTGSPLVLGLDVSAANQDSKHLKAIDAITQVFLKEPSRSVTLTYEVEGASVQSTPSQTGRYLAYLTPLVVGSTGHLPRTVTAYGALNAACMAQDGVLQQCGHSEGENWVVSLGRDMTDTGVYAQVDVS